jgi:hypothetical protein
MHDVVFTWFAGKLLHEGMLAASFLDTDDSSSMG